MMEHLLQGSNQESPFTNKMARYVKTKHTSCCSVGDIEYQKMIQYYLECDEIQREALVEMRKKYYGRYLYACPRCNEVRGEIHAYGWCYQCREWKCNVCQPGAWRSSFCSNCEEEYEEKTMSQQ